MQPTGVTMGLSYGTARHLSRLGHFREMLARAGNNSTDVNRIEQPEFRLLMARALLYSGDPGGARTVALGCQQLPPALQSRSEVVLGLAAKRSGDFTRASQHLQRAVHLAHSSVDSHQEAWARLHLFRLLAEGSAAETLAPMLSELRQAAVRVGDPSLSIYLHEAVAVLEGQTGRPEVAVSHLATARSILEQYPSTWLEELVELTASCLASLRLDFSSASSHAQKARRLGLQTGHDYVSRVLDANQAHADLVSGLLSSAFGALNLLKNAPIASVRFGAIESLGRLLLGLNRLEECQRILDSTFLERNTPRTAGLYSVRWTGVSLAKLLLRQGKLVELHDHIARELTRARDLGDIPLVGALSIVGAEGAIAAQQPDKAGQWLLSSADAGVASDIELSGQFHLACARAVSGGPDGLGQLFRARAERIWAHHGNVLARIEATSFGGPAMEVADYNKDPRFASPPVETTPCVDSAVTPLAVVDCVAGAFDLAARPALLGAELRQLIALLGCESTASVRERPVSAQVEARPFGTQEVSLGHHDGAEVVLGCGAAAKPETSILLASIMRIAKDAVALERLRREERERAAVWPSTQHDAGDDIFADEQMVALVAAARRVASVNVSVLITGETGTGKEVLARIIHEASSRATRVFMPFNCAACPRDMIDAQLFGHRRGAFTGATEHAPGVIRSAAGGTLFLDEIGEAPLDVQPKLLRFLESGEIHPIGEPKPSTADVRIIAATNLDLDQMVSEKKFREDLYYRLNIVQLHLPPLRERRVEVPVLAQHYLRKYAKEFDKGDVRLSEETMEYLLLYSWPGNVRQLANEVRRLVAMAETGAVLMPEHLTPAIAASRRTLPSTDRSTQSNEVIVRLDQPMAAAVEHLERAMILKALATCHGRVEDTARHLGLSRKGLYLKRQRLGLEVEVQDARAQG